MVKQKTFRSEEKFPTPDLQYKQMQYLYADGDGYNFMDQESYDQVVFTKDQLDTVIDYLKEQEVYDVLYFQGRPIAVNAPMFLNLVVKETPPGVKGNTAQGGATKPATMETGLVLQVPLFVNEGDILKVDTREGVYVERLKV